MSLRNALTREQKARLSRKAAKGAVRGGGKAAKLAGKSALRAGKAEAKLAKHALSSREPAGARYTKYALFALAGLAFGALLGRAGKGAADSGSSSSFTGGTGHHAPDSGSPAGQRGQTWGSGSPLSDAGAGGASGYQAPGDPNRAGADRQFSDPSAGPLIGGEERPRMDIGTEQQEVIEQRIRTGFGDDPRVQNAPRVNVEVNDGVAELRGPAESEEIKETFGQIAAETQGVREVRNLLIVGER